MTDLDARMRALRSRTRREILARIWDRDLAAGEIAGTFALTPATISEHLGVLRRAGLVEMTKVGTSRRYRANPTALAGLHGALEDAGKWRPADDLPEQALTTTSTAPVVVAEVAVTTPPETTFTALTDGELYSRWLQAPVTINGDRFAATLEWGTEVRGRYEFVVPPQLIVMAGTSTTATCRCLGTRWRATCGSIPRARAAGSWCTRWSTPPTRRSSWPAPGPWSSDVSRPTSWRPSPDSSAPARTPPQERPHSLRSMTPTYPQRARR